MRLTNLCFAIAAAVVVPACITSEPAVTGHWNQEFLCSPVDVRVENQSGTLGEQHVNCGENGFSIRVLDGATNVRVIIQEEDSFDAPLELQLSGAIHDTVDIGQITL